MKIRGSFVSRLASARLPEWTLCSRFRHGTTEGAVRSPI